MDDEPDLFRKVQRVLAGHPESEVTMALLKSLLAVIGVAAPDLIGAEALLDALPGYLKPALRQEWPNFRLHRAQAHQQPAD